MLKPEITKPTGSPVTLAYVKAYAGITGDESDGILALDVIAATSQLDGWGGLLGRAVLDQTVTQRLPDFTSTRLQYGEATSVASVDYYDTDGVLQSLAASDYLVLCDGIGSYLHLLIDAPETFDRPEAVIITYQAGWMGAAAVPDPIKEAIALIVTARNKTRNEGSAGGVVKRTREKLDVLETETEFFEATTSTASDALPQVMSLIEPYVVLTDEQREAERRARGGITTTLLCRA